MKFNRRILIVDDQKELRLEIKNILMGVSKKSNAMSDINAMVADSNTSYQLCWYVG